MTFSTNGSERIRILSGGNVGIGDTSPNTLFTVGNGDISGEATCGAYWCAREGHRKIGFFWEKGSSGTDYADYFRTAAQQQGLDIVKEVALGPNPMPDATQAAAKDQHRMAEME